MSPTSRLSAGNSPSPIPSHRAAPLGDDTLSASTPQTISSEPLATDAAVYRRVLNLIRETGRFVDDVTSCYFQRMHRYLPVVSRTNFHKSLITLGAIPSSGLSALLLSICLVTLPEAEDPSSVESRSSSEHFYLAAESVLAEIQTLYPPSLQLIQARLILAVHRYAQGRPTDAFEKIASCARMGYAAHIHFRGHLSPSTIVPAGSNSLFDRQEAANTWWGMVICER